MNEDKQLAGLEERLLKFLNDRFEGMQAHLDKQAAELSEVAKRLGRFEERLEDLEDRERYARNASRYVAFAPRIQEPMSISTGSINASRRDSVIFPSLAG